MGRERTGSEGLDSLLNTSRVWMIVTGESGVAVEARDIVDTESVTETMSQDSTQGYELNLNLSENGCEEFYSSCACRSWELNCRSCQNSRRR